MVPAAWRPPAPTRSPRCDCDLRVPLTTAVNVAESPVLSVVDRGCDADADASPSDVDVTVAFQRASEVLAARTWNVPSAAGVM